MAEIKRYKITNTTQKSPKYNAQGRDVRPIRDRVGHPVQFVIDGRSGPSAITIQIGRTVIVDDINEGILKLFRKGFITVEPIKDIADELRLFTKQREKEIVAEPVETLPSEPEPEQPVSILEPEPVSPYEGRMPDSVKAKAVPMGETHDGDRLVNPDGDPNFLSRAKRDMKRTKTSTWAGQKEE
jgi:hypothetical protein